MNYKKIHDLIIDRARKRVYNKEIHQNHHVIPRHEDPNSTETVPLTYKEHYIVHYLRWKFIKTPGNFIAYKLMRNVGSYSTHKLIASEAGKVGGSVTKTRSAGIFSTEWNRSAETLRRWDEGILSKEYQSNLMKSGLAIKAVNIVMENKTGIFSPDWDRSASNIKIWEEMSDEERSRRTQLLRNQARAGGLKSKALGKSDFWDSEKRLIASSKGGRSHKGKKWINNGLKSTRVMTDDLNYYLNNGWKLGLKNKVEV